MVVIFKKEAVEDALERSKIRNACRGSRKNLIVSRCLKCKLLFETFIQYQRRTCMLCRYEGFHNKKKFLSSLTGKRVWDENSLYTHYLKKAVLLENNRRRILKASGCRVINWANSDRLIPFEDYLDLLPNN